MSDEAKLTAIRWRRILFGFHLLVWLAARLAVGSIRQMPPAEIYDDLAIWGIIVFAHGAILALLDGRDHAAPMSPRFYPLTDSQRRMSLLTIDALLWIIFTASLASRVIPEAVILQYAAPLGLAWLAHTGFALFHVLLVLSAEIGDRMAIKPKRDEKLKSVSAPLLLSDDGELVEGLELPHYQPADKKSEDSL